MLRFLLALILILTVCLSPGCGSATRTVVTDTRPTAAQAQAQADSGRSIAELSSQLAAAKQRRDDAAAAYAQAANDLAAAKLARDELILSLIAAAAVFLAVAAEALDFYEVSLAWLLKPASYVLAGVAVTAACFRVALPYVGLVEGFLFIAMVGIVGYALRNAAIVKRIEAEAEVVGAAVEAEGKRILTSMHLLKAATAAPAPPPVGTVIPPA